MPIHQLNSKNPHFIRDTHEKLALAAKIIHDVDNAKPKVLIQVEVLQARRDKVHQLGIYPGSTATLSYTPPSDSSSTKTKAPLSERGHIDTNYSITLPGATANALFTDSTSHIIQNPELRSVDGQPAKLRVGDRVPVATGSLSSTSASVNPLVNTQFTYIDVGVNIDITPRVHPNHEVSLKVKVEVSSVTGTSTIGGIQQPIISQRKIEHDIRLKDGEVNVLGGLFERTDTKTLNGWPGFAKIPFLRYFTSDTKTEHEENEVLIVLIPRIVRVPEWTKANLRPMFSGTETNVQVRRESDLRSPSQPEPAAPNPPAQQQPPANANPAPGAPAAGGPGNTVPAAGAANATAKIRFEPQSLTLKVGQRATVGVLIENVNDLFSIPMLLQYNPAFVSVEEVQHGGFLSGGTQEIAIVSQSFKEKGQYIISATRQPNTPGVSGSGTLLRLVVKALATATTKLSIVQVTAKDSQQNAIPLVTGEATLQVQP